MTALRLEGWKKRKGIASFAIVLQDRSASQRTCVTTSASQQLDRSLPSLSARLASVCRLFDQAHCANIVDFGESNPACDKWTASGRLI